MGAPISCLIAAYVSCVVLSYSNNNYGVCMVRYTIYKYAWYSIQVYNIPVCMVQYTSIQSHTEARWWALLIRNMQARLLVVEGLPQAHFLVILKVCAIQECAIKLHIDMQAQVKGTE